MTIPHAILHTSHGFSSCNINLLLSFICTWHSTTQYLGFGLSGIESQTLMFGADATIAWVDGSGVAQAQDYYLSNYVQVCLSRMCNEPVVQKMDGNCD